MRRVLSSSSIYITYFFIHLLTSLKPTAYEEHLEKHGVETIIEKAVRQIEEEAREDRKIPFAEKEAQKKIDDEQSAEFDKLLEQLLLQDWIKDEVFLFNFFVVF